MRSIGAFLLPQMSVNGSVIVDLLFGTENCNRMLLSLLLPEAHVAFDFSGFLHQTISCPIDLIESLLCYLCLFGNPNLGCPQSVTRGRPRPGGHRLPAKQAVQHRNPLTLTKLLTKLLLLLIESPPTFGQFQCALLLFCFPQIQKAFQSESESAHWSYCPVLDVCAADWPVRIMRRAFHVLSASVNSSVC